MRKVYLAIICISIALFSSCQKMLWKAIDSWWLKEMYPYGLEEPLAYFDYTIQRSESPEEQHSYTIFPNESSRPSITNVEPVYGGFENNGKKVYFEVGIRKKTLFYSRVDSDTSFFLLNHKYIVSETDILDGLSKDDSISGYYEFRLPENKNQKEQYYFHFEHIYLVGVNNVVSKEKEKSDTVKVKGKLTVCRNWMHFTSKIPLKADTQ